MEEDFNYKFSDGENLNEVALKNVTALENLLEIHVGQSIVVGSHGTSLYDNKSLYGEIFI